MERQNKFDKEPKEKEFVEKLVTLNRTSKTVKGGRRMSFAALSVVGDQKGRVGYGFGKANDVTEAIKKSLDRAKRNLVTLPIKKGTVPHDIIEHVEQVIYTDHPHEVDWVDKGSELDRLSKKHSEHLKWSNELRGKYMELDTENAKLKDKVKELEKRIRTENPEKRKIGTTKTTIEMESEEFESLLKAIDFGAEWMNENGYSIQENKFRALYDKLKEL